MEIPELPIARTKKKKPNRQTEFYHKNSRVCQWTEQFIFLATEGKERVMFNERKHPDFFNVQRSFILIAHELKGSPKQIR